MKRRPPARGDGRRGDERRGDPKRAGPRPPPTTAPPQREGEIVYGLRAGLAVIASRREDVLRVAHTGEVRGELGALARGLPVAEVGEGELARIAETTHHEGLVVMTRPRRWAALAQLADRLVASKGLAVALDRVRNPYNVGAILRTAAFLGVDAAILGAIAPHPALAPDAIRVAEGGAEKIALARTTDLADTLARLRARGVRTYGAAGDAGSAIGMRFERPAILVVGHEREGISPRVRAECDRMVAIPGTGAVESLNVAVAAGLLIGEIVRPTR